MAAEMFDRTPTTGIIIFEALIVLATIISIFYLGKIKKNIIPRYFIVLAGIFIFEMFTAPMWNNYHLGVWAYLYRDVSWILTMGWATCILLSVTLTDHYFTRLSAQRRFFVSVFFMMIAGIIGESLVVNLGIRTYSPEVQDAVWGYLPLLNIPANTFYYVPVFTALVIGFYGYWSLVLDDKPVMPMKKRKWGRDFLIALAGILLFEIMIEPMVTNQDLPKWSYVYKDISFLITGGWIVIVWLALKFTDRFFIGLELGYRFILYLIAIAIIALPIEAWLISEKIRAYGPSATKNLTGINLPGLHVPVEVMFAIPLYFALIVAFIRYWEIILDNRRLQ